MTCGVDIINFQNERGDLSPIADQGGVDLIRETHAFDRGQCEVDTGFVTVVRRGTVVLIIRQVRKIAVAPTLNRSPDVLTVPLGGAFTQAFHLADVLRPCWRTLGQRDNGVVRNHKTPWQITATRLELSPSAECAEYIPLLLRE